MYAAIAPTLLARWANFYVIVGSSAAALTGLQFIVIALMAETRLPRRDHAIGIDAFSTPTIAYFSAVLLISAVMSAPWNVLPAVAALVAVCGAAGTVYSLIVARRAQRMTAYRLVFEDWVWHIALPLAAQATLLAAGLALVRHPNGALYTIAAAALLLLFIGIHNAWDTVTFLVLQRLEPGRDDGERRERPPS
ncbi:MAG TPA: hypothetical protein VN970_05035 [Thermoanaerobaculia bacterium]|nr:hypothetical protein [Thermoanaerobaculia bacterium]